MFDFTNEKTVCSVQGITQLELESLYSKHQKMRCIREEFQRVNAHHDLEEAGIPADFGIDLLSQLALFKRTTISVLVGILKRHFEDTSDNPAQEAADMVYKCCEHDFCDYDQISGQIIVIYTLEDLSDDLVDRLDRFQYPLPMIEEPQPVTTNKETGYRSIKKSVILKDNHHDDDVCLDHLNRVNAQPLALNQDVVAFIQNTWRNLDKKKVGESDDEFKARKKAFEKYDTVSRDVIDSLNLHRDRFWLTHAYDKRGRVYAQGYHVNYQSNDWCKAVVGFADGEPLNET